MSLQQRYGTFSPRPELWAKIVGVLVTKAPGGAIVLTRDEVAAFATAAETHVLDLSIRPDGALHVTWVPKQDSPA